MAIVNNIRKKKPLAAFIVLLIICSAIVIFFYRAKKGNSAFNNYYTGFYHNTVEKNKLSVEVKFLKCREARKILECDLCKYQIQPIAIKIKNHSSAIYYFAKREVAPRYARAEESFLRCFSTKKPWYGAVPILRQKLKAINAKKRRAYLSKEIADDFIYPKQVKSGIIFLAQLNRTKELVVTLINRDTGERIIFEFLVK